MLLIGDGNTGKTTFVSRHVSGNANKLHLRKLTASSKKYEKKQKNVFGKILNFPILWNLNS